MKKINKSLAPWMISFLKFAGLYNLGWGVFILQRPLVFYQALNEGVDTFPWILYPFGLAVLGMGIAYLIAARDPLSYWWLIGLGLASKLFGPLFGWFILATTHFKLPNFTLHVIFNDLIWVIPMALVFYKAFKEWQNTELVLEVPFPEILTRYRTQKGEKLSTLNQEQPLLMIFLRHFGCTFCKEALQEISAKRTDLEKAGSRLVFIHMATETQAAAYFAPYGLENLDRVSDPNCTLYKAFSLKRAKFNQVFGWSSWQRGFEAGLKGNGIGKLVGDGFRMPGVFLVYQDQILKRFQHQQASDLPDYEYLASCELGVRS